MPKNHRKRKWGWGSQKQHGWIAESFRVTFAILVRTAVLNTNGVRFGPPCFCLPKNRGFWHLNGIPRRKDNSTPNIPKPSLYKLMAELTTSRMFHYKLSHLAWYFLRQPKKRCQYRGQLGVTTSIWRMLLSTIIIHPIRSMYGIFTVPTFTMNLSLNVYHTWNFFNERSKNSKKCPRLHVEGPCLFNVQPPNLPSQGGSKAWPRYGLVRGSRCEKVARNHIIGGKILDTIQKSNPGLIYREEISL